MNSLIRTLTAAGTLAALAACQSLPTHEALAVKHMEVNGVRLPYVEQGHGEPVVFIHGAVSDHRTWDRQRAALAERQYRAISYTQRWFGTTAWADAPRPGWIAAHADDLAALIRGLNAGPVHLVAWSHGGHIALNAALKHPELVKSAFVFEPVVPSYVTDPADFQLIRANAPGRAPGLAAALQAGDMQTMAKELLNEVSERRGYFEGLPQQQQAIVLDNAHTMPPMLMREQGAPISCEQLAQIKPRVAIVRAREARPFFRVIADAAARCMPAGPHIVVPNATHMWPAEDVPRFTETLVGFLKAR